MAVSAFKSNTRRGQLFNLSDKETKHDSTNSKAPPRRSRSVSAFSRSTISTTSDIPFDDFLIKRDNPLFSTTATSKPAAELEDVTRRGRSFSRDAKPSGIGRSLSRDNTCRRARSVSRGPPSRSQSLNSEVRFSVSSAWFYCSNSKCFINYLFILFPFLCC